MFRITRSSTSAAEAVNQRHQWPVRLVAENTEDDTPAKIFVMQSKVDENIGDQFSCVASAIQMTDLPEDAVNSEGPFFRVSEVTVLCRTAEAAEEFQTKVIAAVQDLVDNLESAARLSDEEIITVTPSIDA